MKTTLIASIATLLFGQGIDAHGYVQQLRVNGNLYYTTWNPYKHPGQGLTTITRKFLNNGPVTDGTFLSDPIICNYGAKDAPNNVPSPLTAEIPAGAKVEFLWTPWESDHPGPVMTYLAKCPGKCSDFAANSGNIWVKIDQEGYDASYSVPWASKRLPNQNSTWPITLPKTLQSGEYILRHEILGLQRAVRPELAQFYPACHQITITGGGSTPLPAGIALPGAYTLTDPGISLEYRDISATNPYTPPGGPVWGDNGWGAQPSPRPTTTAGPTTSRVPTTSSTVRTSTRTSTIRTSTTRTSTVRTSTRTSTRTLAARATAAFQVVWGQCGGIGYTGPTVCEPGSYCSFYNIYESQCLPDSHPPFTPFPPISTTASVTP